MKKAGGFSHAKRPAYDQETYPVAVFLGLLGVVLHLLLSPPVLNIIGLPYGGEEAGWLSKIHPGSALIILSFIVLLCSRGNPAAQTLHMARQQTAFFTFLVIYLLIFFYWLLRGPKGVGLIIDIHLVIPMIALVLSYTPHKWYRPIVYGFIGIAGLNAAIGIFESITQTRLFPFNPDWEVLHQDYFRASALRGHPLANAVFDSVSLFVLVSLRMNRFLKLCLFLLMLTALISFGGRAALILSCIGLVVLGLYLLIQHIKNNPPSVMRLAAAFLGFFLLPALCFSLLYSALHSGMGERLMAYSGISDDSATVRLASPHALDLMTPADLIFGMDDDQVNAISNRLGLVDPATDIENPWLLMFMFLGGFMFPLWLGGLGCFLWRLMAGASPALKIAVIDYFLIASTSNSFGRKDVTFMILAGIVVCAKKLEALRQTETL